MTERCSCGNDFAGDNLCMPSACMWEDWCGFCGTVHSDERCAATTTDASQTGERND